MIAAVVLIVWAGVTLPLLALFALGLTGELYNILQGFCAMTPSTEEFIDTARPGRRAHDGSDRAQVSIPARAADVANGYRSGVNEFVFPLFVLLS